MTTPTAPTTSSLVVPPGGGERIWDGLIDTVVKVPTSMTGDLLSITSMAVAPGYSAPRRPGPSGGSGAKAIPEAVFERTDVLGVTDDTFTLTAHAKARGWDAAFGAGAVTVKGGRFGAPGGARGLGPTEPTSST